MTQIDADQSVCPACGADGLELFPVFHHMICAYVGPEYDFEPAVAGYTCPKCRRGIVSGDPACEIVGARAAFDVARKQWYRRRRFPNNRSHVSR
jgi:hypothetical protein